MEDKRSRALPFIALLLCMTLIVGATFALFTSKKTIKIAVNAAEVNLDAFIKADSLKTYSLGVEQFDNEADVGYFELGGSAALTTVDEVPTLTISEMAPGDKAELTVGIKNKSTIDIMWRVQWEIKGDLTDALVVTADGKAAASTM